MTTMPKAATTLAWLVLLCGGSVQANEVVSVGRIDIQLPGTGWQSQDLPDQGNPLSGAGETHRQQTETKVLLRSAPDQTIDVVFIVRANASGKGRFSGIAYSDARCEGPSGTFVEGDPPSPAARSFRCLFVSPSGTLSTRNDFLPQVLGPLSEKGWRLAPRMQVMVAKQYAHTGAFADVTALVAPEALPALSGASGESAELLPAGISANSVQWARMLQKAVTDSVYSVWGKLPVPDLLPTGTPSASN